jgi:hypothetical protein
MAAPGDNDADAMAFGEHVAGEHVASVQSGAPRQESLLVRARTGPPPALGRPPCPHAPDERAYRALTGVGKRA